MRPLFRHATALFPFFTLLLPPTFAFDAAEASNQLGITLLRKISAEDTHNLLISPYSLSSVLAPLYVGSAGETRVEFERVLGFPEKNSLVEKAFARLRRKIAEADGSITIDSANRIFIQQDFPIRDEFGKQLHDSFDFEPQALDFRNDPTGSAFTINNWVSRQTHGKITSIVPPSMPIETRMILINALYLRAEWEDPFERGQTRPRPFRTNGNATTIDLPTMHRTVAMGYVRESGFQVASVRYVNSDYHCLIILPDQRLDTTSGASRLTADQLKRWSRLARNNDTLVDLQLPSFTFANIKRSLVAPLKDLGIRHAFDDPKRSANFDPIFPRTRDHYLAVSAIYQSTFVAVDEGGTEAAAVTTEEIQLVSLGVVMPAERPIEMHVNRPFLFAIQHAPTGACLFLGRVVDPKKTD